MKDVKAIIFDFDGTMAHTFTVWNDVINIDFLRKRGVNVSKLDTDKLYGKSFTGITEHFKEIYNLDAPLETLVEERKDTALYHFKNTVKLNQDLKNLLSLLIMRESRWLLHPVIQEKL